MNKLIALLLVFALTFSLCACGSSEKSEPATAPAIADATPPATLEGEESAIEDIGKVEVEQKLLSVEITVPADFVGETTQADLDANVSAGKFLSAKLNDDGSVTYKMTKGQHKEVMEGIKQSIEEALVEMIASDDYSFTKIEPNADFTKFKVTTTSSELNLAESFSVLAFYMYGGMYNIFNGTEVEKVGHDPFSGTALHGADA